MTFPSYTGERIVPTRRLRRWIEVATGKKGANHLYEFLVHFASKDGSLIFLRINGPIIYLFCELLDTNRQQTRMILFGKKVMCAMYLICTFVLYFSDDKNPYFKVDLGYPDEIKGVATQGKDIQDGKYWFVRSFAMSFSLDGKTWFNYTGDGSRTKVSVEEVVL